MDYGMWLTSKNSRFPTLVAAHQADIRGPVVGRGTQVENRWAKQRLVYKQNPMYVLGLTYVCKDSN